MIIRYVGLTKYNDIEKNININLGGHFRFLLEKNNKLMAYPEKNYIDGDYLYKNGIKEISAIVGKNTAGKTTVLRMISSVLGNKRKEYVLIEEDIEKKTYYIYTDLDVEFGETKNLFNKYNYSIENVGSVSKICLDITQIYFSNIFDKSCPLDNSDNLIDISINKELRRYLGEETDEIAVANHVQADIAKNNKTITEFRYREINKKIDLAIFLKESNSVDENKMIFHFPEYINIFFSENWEKRNEYLEKINKTITNEEQAELETITRSLDEEINSKKDSEKEFCAYIIQEIVLKRLYEDKNSFEFIKKTLKQKESEIPVLSGLIEYKEVETKTMAISVGKENIKKQETYQTKNVYQIVLNEIDMLLDRLNDSEYIYTEDGIKKVEDEMTYINSYLGDVASYESKDAVEEVGDNIISLRENWNDYEFEDIEEILNRTIYALENLRREVYEGYIATLNDSEVVSTDIEMLHNMDEVAIDEEAEGLLDEIQESLKEELENVITLMNLLEKILKKSNTRIVHDKEGSSIRVKLRDKEVLKFYEMIQDNQYQTFNLVIDHDDLSSGQNAYLDMCARFYFCMKNEKLMEKERLVLLLDEGELFLHPQAQVKYIENLHWLLPQIFKNKKIQVILTTNSPFLVSDIQKSNVLPLKSLNQKEGLNIQGKLDRTFGANINNLLLNNFFMDESIIGLHAKNIINELISKINDMKGTNNAYEDIEMTNMKKVINNIGDELIRKRLEQLMKETEQSGGSIEQRIRFHENEILKLKEDLARKN